MKKLAAIFLISIVLFSCKKDDDNYRRNAITYDLYQASAFDYSGTVTFSELPNGSIEVLINLLGEKSSVDYFFPAHLHFGSYDDIDAPIAYLLNPINIKTLNSVTLLDRLSNGQQLTFEELSNFDGHIKIHLADSGPEYQVILSAGNIGANDNSPEAFILENMTLCSPYY